MYKSGFIGIIGRPNVGKSTLLNTMLGEQIAITTPLPQTTQHQLKGILTTEDSQMVFVDTPGVHSSNKKFGKILNEAALNLLNDRDIDLILYMVDVSRRIGEEEEYLAGKLLNHNKPVLLVYNKIDTEDEHLEENIETLNELFENREAVHISALENLNIDTLIDKIKSLLPEGLPFYDEDQLTDKNMRFIAAEILRKQLIVNLKDEIPHACTVRIEEYKELEDSVAIKAIIYTDTPSQKKIVIGAKAQKLKQMKHFAKRELKKFIDCPITLDLHVKVKEKWRSNEPFLKSLGFETNKSKKKKKK